MDYREFIYLIVSTVFAAGMVFGLWLLWRIKIEIKNLSANKIAKEILNAPIDHDIVVIHGMEMTSSETKSRLKEILKNNKK